MTFDHYDNFVRAKFPMGEFEFTWDVIHGDEPKLNWYSLTVYDLTLPSQMNAVSGSISYNEFLDALSVVRFIRTLHNLAIEKRPTRFPVKIMNTKLCTFGDIDEG